MGGGGRGGKRRREKSFPSSFLALTCNHRLLLLLHYETVSLSLSSHGEREKKKKERGIFDFFSAASSSSSLLYRVRFSCFSASNPIAKPKNLFYFIFFWFSPHPFALLHLSFLLRPRPFFSKTTDTEVGRSVACSGATDGDALRAVFAPPSHTSLSCNLFLASVFDGVEVSAGGTDPDGAGLEGRNSTN